MEKDFAPALVSLERARLLEPDSPAVKDADAAYHKELGYAYLLAAGKKREEREYWREKAIREFWKAVKAGSENEDLGHVRIVLGLSSPALQRIAGSYDIYLTAPGTRDPFAGPYPVDVALGDVVFLLAVDAVDPSKIDISDVSIP